MAEYIERRALINAIATSTEPFTTGLVFRAINNQPAADVVPVRRGRWLDGVEGSMLRICSLCGFTAGAPSHRFCPACGAKMEVPNDD